jgi:hypothetical protein
LKEFLEDENVAYIEQDQKIAAFDFIEKSNECLQQQNAVWVIFYDILLTKLFIRV